MYISVCVCVCILKLVFVFLVNHLAVRKANAVLGRSERYCGKT
jgi:hypothetical protein